MDRNSLEATVRDIPNIGTMDFNKLKVQMLILDMEKRFESGDIRKLADYIGLLKLHACNEARVKLLEKYSLFERAMNYCLVEAERNLAHRNMREIL